MQYQEKLILKFSLSFKEIKCNHFAGLLDFFWDMTFVQLMTNKYKIW